MARSPWPLIQVLLVVCIIILGFGWYLDHRYLANRLVQIGLISIPSESRVELARVDMGLVDMGLVDDATIRMLIFAMGDPSIEVVYEADQSLRRISGKHDGFGDDVYSLNSKQRLELASKWINWYLESDRS